MFLGIDTSCYTTSMALMDDTGKLLSDERIMLTVKEGRVGLRQSEMVFQHIKNLPLLAEKIFSKNKVVLNAIAVSTKPCDDENSYMPAFLSGLSVAKTLSLATNAKFFETTHQRNHISAGLWSVKRPDIGFFIAVHISGGTTDIVLVKKSEEGICSLEKIGESIDLNIGQYIDRVGVMLGLSFPAGKELEKIALSSTKKLEIPFFAKDNKVSFSGPFSATKRLWATGVDKADIAAGTQLVVAKSLAKIIANICYKYNIFEVLLIGGVSSNEYIRSYLARNIKNVDFLFPEARCCSDNAIGNAYLAKKLWRA